VATLRDIQRRIRSVQSTQKITRAMKLVAAAKLRRAQERILAARPYASKMAELLGNLVGAASAGDGEGHPLLERREGPRRQIVIITADRGLAGAFNSNIVRRGVAAGRQHDSEGRNPVYFASGRRPASSLTFRGLEPADTFTGFTDRPSYADARRIAERLIAAYVDEEVDQVEIFYNGYISPINQVVRRETLLPLQQATVLEEDDEEDEKGDEEHSGPRALVEYEPDPEEILKRLVPDYVEISIYRALLESTASEHGARMTAMRNASENARTLIEDLTLEMNRARQAEITQEILEVVGGAEGLTG
jgi:F-type H+-transporting ATPase subunit gamma